MPYGLMDASSKRRREKHYYLGVAFNKTFWGVAPLSNLSMTIVCLYRWRAGQHQLLQNYRKMAAVQLFNKAHHKTTRKCPISDCAYMQLVIKEQNYRNMTAVKLQTILQKMYQLV